jgi:putative N6-adenine-specific DNA methylase
MNTVKFIAISTFGLEKLVKNEIVRLGYDITSVENGSIAFDAPLTAIAKLNLNLRCAERLFLEVGKFRALSFEELFQGIKSISWENYIPGDGAFPVNAKSYKSKLFSLSDIQAISKKAIVEKLKEEYGFAWFRETGAEVAIHVNFLNDEAQVLLDTSGSGLHRRGYREKGNEAPLKETLAAGLVLLSNWYGDTPLIDPMCGTGTILIEAAMFKRNIAPGLSRKFASEAWDFIPENCYKDARKAAYEAINYDLELNLKGYDISEKTIAIARENAELAGVDDCITFEVQDIRNWQPSEEDAYARIICNPPYGERLEDEKKAFALYEVMGKIIHNQTTWSSFILTSHEKFEVAYEKKSTRNRKLYNGKIKCYYYQYLGPKPPRME